MRASKVVGASVYNDEDGSIGSADDLLLSDSVHKAGTAVISVGGFPGMGSKLAAKASLEGMADYRYTNA